jgi:hypothetical protein
MRILLAAILGIVVASTNLCAQQEQQTFTFVLDGSFGKVWSAVEKAMAVRQCGQAQVKKVVEPEEVDGFYKGTYVSDFCVLVKGEDSTQDVMEAFGDLPRIRNGMWISGRVQFRIAVREEQRNKTKVILKAELSGFEEYITNQVHFWNSNGKLEEEMVALIKKFTAEAVDSRSEEE